MINFNEVFSSINLVWQSFFHWVKGYIKILHGRSLLAFQYFRKCPKLTWRVGKRPSKFYGKNSFDHFGSFSHLFCLIPVLPRLIINICPLHYYYQLHTIGNSCRNCRAIINLAADTRSINNNNKNLFVRVKAAAGGNW